MLRKQVLLFSVNLEVLIKLYYASGISCLISYQGFWYCAKKKAKFRRIFRGKFAEKSANFAGFSREKVKIRGKISRFPGFSQEKSQNSQRNRPILRDFRGRKVKIRRKIGPFRGILAEKSEISKDFQGQIVRKIGRCHGKFRGETLPRINQKKTADFAGFWGEIFVKIDQFCVNMTSVV